MTETLISPQEAAERLNAAGIHITPRSVRAWCRKGKLRATQLPTNSYWQVHADHVQELIDSTTAAS